MTAVPDLAPATEPALARFLRDFDEFLYFPPIPWHFSWQRSQTVISAFAAAHEDRSGWVFPPLGLLPHSPLRLDSWRRLGRALAARLAPAPVTRAGGYPLPPNLRQVDAWFVPGAGAWRSAATLAISPTNRRLLRKRGRRLVVAGYVNDLVLRFAAGADFVILDLAERRQKNPALSPRAKRLERELAGSADVLVADNRATLADYASERAALGRPGHYLPQGFTPSARTRVASSAPDAPLAYLGNLHHAVDVEWLRRLVRANPMRKLRLCGEVLDGRARSLLALPNVEYWGPVAHSEIPRFLAGATWGVVPYVVDEWTAGVFPTKLLEYLDCGLPVLSTALPEVAQFRQLPFVRILDDPGMPLPRPSTTGLDAFLAKHTWEARMRSYGELLIEARS